MSSESYSVEAWHPWSPDAPFTRAEDARHTMGTYGFGPQRYLWDRKGTKMGAPINLERAAAVLSILRENHPEPVKMNKLTKETGLEVDKVVRILNNIGGQAGIYEDSISERTTVYGLIDLYRTVEGVDV